MKTERERCRMNEREIHQREKATEIGMERERERERINESLQTKNSTLNPLCRAGK